MKLYGVCIGSSISEGNFMFARAKNKTEARKQANTYRRQWQISEPIMKIVEIPNAIEREGDDTMRAYAVRAAG